jgi:hypothetical protein
MRVINFEKILRIREIFKAIQQLSWNLAQIEKQFSVQSLNEDEKAEMLSIYKNYLDDLDEQIAKARNKIEE